MSEDNVPETLLSLNARISELQRIRTNVISKDDIKVIEYITKRMNKIYDIRDRLLAIDRDD